MTPICGHIRSPLGAAYCPDCGARLDQEEEPECDHRGQRGRFCGRCGEEIGLRERIRALASEVLADFFNPFVLHQVKKKRSNGDRGAEVIRRK